MDATPKTIEEEVRDKLGEITWRVILKHLTPKVQQFIANEFVASLSRLREQIAKEDIEWLESHRMTRDKLKIRIGNADMESGGIENITSYNQALSDFIAYKHNQIK